MKKRALTARKKGVMRERSSDRRVVEKEERGEGRVKGGRDIQEQQTDGEITRYRGKNGEEITGS